MDRQKRMQYFDGKKVLLDDYDDEQTEKFDQFYDDVSNLKKDSKTFNKSMNNPQKSDYEGKVK